MVAQLRTMEENLSSAWYIWCEKILLLPTRVLDLVETISGHFLLLGWVLLSRVYRWSQNSNPLDAIFQDKATWSGGKGHRVLTGSTCCGNPYYQVVGTYLDQVLFLSITPISWGNEGKQDHKTSVWMCQLMSCYLKSTSVGWANQRHAWLTKKGVLP